MDQNQRVDAPLSNEPGGNHSLAKSRCGGQHARLMLEQRQGGRFLLRPQRAAKRNVQRTAAITFIALDRLDFERLDRLPDLVQATSGKSDVLRMILGTGNDSWLVIRRQTHRLRPIEFGILKRRQAKQPVAKRGHEPFFANIDLVGQDQFKLLRQGPDDGWFLGTVGRRSCPWILILLVRGHKADSNDPPSAIGEPHEGFDPRATHSRKRREECPLIFVRPELVINKHAVAPPPRRLLERERNQIAETAFG